MISPDQRRHRSEYEREPTSRRPSYKPYSNSTQSARPPAHIIHISPPSRSRSRMDPQDDRPHSFSYPHRDSRSKLNDRYDRDLKEKREKPRAHERVEESFRGRTHDCDNSLSDRLAFGNRKLNCERSERFMDYLPRASNEEAKRRAPRVDKRYVTEKIYREENKYRERVWPQDERISRYENVSRLNSPPSRYTVHRSSNDGHASADSNQHQNSRDRLRHPSYSFRHGHPDGIFRDEYLDHRNRSPPRLFPRDNSERVRRPRIIPVRTFPEDDSSEASIRVGRERRAPARHHSPEPASRSRPHSSRRPLRPASPHHQSRSSQRPSSPRPSRANVTVTSLPDYYAILRIPPTASAGEVGRAARKRRIEVHPDRLKRPNMSKQKQDEIDEAAKAVGMAADVLGNEDKRNEYDRGLRKTRM